MKTKLIATALLTALTVPVFAQTPAAATNEPAKAAAPAKHKHHKAHHKTEKAAATAAAPAASK